MSAAGILTFQKQLFYNKGISMYEIVNNDAPDYLTHNSFLFPSPTTPTRGITCIYHDQGLICSKVASHSQVRPSGIPYPQISNPAFLFHVLREICIGILCPRTTCRKSNSNSLVPLCHCLLCTLFGQVYPLK